MSARTSGLEPHSPAWFAALRRNSPRQAAITAAVVRLAGRDDVCSMCGDGPARDYDDTDPPFLPVRLCDDCRPIQIESYGARLTARGTPTADAG